MVVAVAVVAAACLPSGGGLARPTDTGSLVTVQTSPAVSASTSTSVVSSGVVAEDEIAELLPSTPVTTAPPGVVRQLMVERQQFSLECFRRYGFDGEIQEDAGILFDVPPDQQERFVEVNARCVEEEAAEFGIEVGVPSVESLRRHYRAYLYVRECMIAEGYPVDDPPSMEVFVESGGSVWHPYDAVMRSSPSSFSRLEETCPQDLFYLLEVLDLEE